MHDSTTGAPGGEHPPTHEWVKTYTGDGIQTVPIPPGEKGPREKGWPNLRITDDEIPRYWNNGQGVGLLLGEPSGGLVDYDLDHPFAIKLAPFFLRGGDHDLFDTLKHGRDGALDSHLWYFADEVLDGRLVVRAPKIGNEEGETLMELRGTGFQTAVHPTIHPDTGSSYTWSGNGYDVAKIKRFSLDVLKQYFRLHGLAVLIAYMMPKKGRHEYSKALAGYLLRDDRVYQADLEAVFGWAWRTAGYPDDVEAALRNLRDTAEKLQTGRKSTGGPTLGRLFPGLPESIRAFCEWEDETGAKPEGSAADRLVSYVMDSGAELFVDQTGEAHILVGDCPTPLTQKAYPYLRELFWEHEGKTVARDALGTAVGTLEAFALRAGNVRELHTRAAWIDGTLYYELRKGRVVRVSAGRWEFDDAPPVLFRRLANLKPLPDPVRGGNLDEFDNFVSNLKTERDLRLSKAYIVLVVLEHILRPILLVTGPMGAGKSTLSRVMKKTLDPTTPEAIRLDHRDFLQKCAHGFITLVDNQSGLPEWASDALCRLVTGEADSKRKLYTDSEDVIFELKRAVLLNGINVPTDRGDVLDRCLTIELDRIRDDQRKPERVLNDAFEGAHPELLGAIFDALSRTLAELPNVRLDKLPRLADWGEYAAAFYRASGWGEDQFTKDWGEVVLSQNQATLDGSPIAQAIIFFMRGRKRYEGLATDLHDKLGRVAAEHDMHVERDDQWPRSSRTLWNRIREIQPLLEGLNIGAERERTKLGTKITLTRTGGDDGGDNSEHRHHGVDNSDYRHPDRHPESRINTPNGKNGGDVAMFAENRRGQCLEQKDTNNKISGVNGGNGDHPTISQNYRNSATIATHMLSLAVLGLLRATPLPMSEIVEQIGVDPDDYAFVRRAVEDLESRGRIESTDHGWRTTKIGE